MFCIFQNIGFNNQDYQIQTRLSGRMADNFKYDDYEEDFQINNGSNLQDSKPDKKQPETIKMLGRQQKKQADTQSKPPTDTSTKGKLIDQHNKLKSQLKQLATKMDEIIQKERQRKKKRLQGQGDDDDERIVQLKKKLKDDESKIQKIKSEITRLRKNMDNKYDMNRIVDKQNELKHLQKQLQVLEEEKQALQKIRKTQDRAIKNQDDRESKNKKSRMQEELKQVSTQTKKQLQSINEKQKQVRKLHQQYITKSEKCKQIEAKLSDKKKVNQMDEITPESISKLQEQLKEVQGEIAEIQRQGNQKMRVLQKERKQLKNQMDRKKLILDQKEKQLRLNQLKHKQIIRLINSSQQQQIVNESRIEKQNKGDPKRVIQKKGRDAPSMEFEGEQEPKQKEQPKQETKVDEKKADQGKKKQKEKQQYGFTANLDDEGIIDD